MTATNTYYADVLKGWQKQWGSKPTAEMLQVVHIMPGPRNKPKQPGVEALHLAMCLRPDGCTVPQFQAAGGVLKGAPCGPANNTRRDYVAAGLFAETIMPGSKPYAYRLTLTAKGKAAVKAAMTAAAAAIKAAEKAAKADQPKAAKKAASKPRRAKAPVAGLPAPVAPVAAPADQPSTH